MLDKQGYMHARALAPEHTHARVYTHTHTNM